MINDLIDGISIAINNHFNKEENKYEIYSESIEQGLQEPCFYIVALNPSSVNKLPPRYYREYPFDIHYFPLDTINTKREMYEVAEQLILVLEYIDKLDNKYKGTNIRYEIIDNVLHFFVTYKVYVKVETEEQNKMESVITNIGVKE